MFLVAVASFVSALMFGPGRGIDADLSDLAMRVTSERIPVENFLLAVKARKCLTQTRQDNTR